MNCLLKSEISNSLKSICVAIMATHNYSIIFFEITIQELLTKEPIRS